MSSPMPSPFLQQNYKIHDLNLKWYCLPSEESRSISTLNKTKNEISKIHAS
jgi:hypothetical protein